MTKLQMLDSLTEIMARADVCQIMTDDIINESFEVSELERRLNHERGLIKAHIILKTLYELKEIAVMAFETFDKEETDDEEF